MFASEGGMTAEGAHKFEAKEGRVYILNVSDSVDGVKTWIEDEASKEVVSDIEVVQLKRIQSGGTMPIFIPMR